MIRVFYFSALALFCIVLTHCKGKHETGSSDIAQAYVLEALDIIKNHSIKMDLLDWDSLEHDVLNRIDEINAQSTQDCYPVIKYVLWSLGDRHSHFKEPSQAKDWAETAFGTHFGIQATLLNDQIAYIRMPGIGSGHQPSLVAYADSLQQKIAGLDGMHIKGWILDLRYNIGGNCWPMMTGIGPLLGEGICGSFVTADSSKRHWFYSNGAAGIDTVNIVRVSDQPYFLKMPECPIAVLTSDNTMSSGEVITIAFRGKENTKSFGEPTRGLSTGNASFMLSDSAMLVLTTSIFADRNGHLYGDKVVPDEVIKDKHPAHDLKRNEVVLAAIGWIKAHSKR